jgi:hypothetical protein
MRRMTQSKGTSSIRGSVLGTKNIENKNIMLPPDLKKDAAIFNISDGSFYNSDKEMAGTDCNDDATRKKVTVVLAANSNTKGEIPKVSSSSS